MTKTIRIGGASAFWGDSFIAVPQLLTEKLDYLVFDYLAEITMSIMARQRARDPKAGYATDFVTVTMKRHLKDIARNKIKVVANAGGVNPKACAEAVEALIAEQGLSLKVAYVTGDDILPKNDELRRCGTQEMFTGDQMPASLMSLNAYLGARPIARALELGADIVVTGRCVDSAVTLGPCLYEFGWKDTDYDLLAAGSLAGHILECGAQACGGTYTDWRESNHWENIGYPIGEMSADGTLVVTKPANTGGCVTFGTCAEQMLYEIGDPQAYMLPDVACDFSQVKIEEVGPDRVRVSGAKGLPPTDTYKASGTYEDGFRVGMYLTIGGIDAREKAEKTAAAVFERMRSVLKNSNMPPFRETSTEVLGAEASYGPHARPGARATREVVLKIAAKHENERALSLLVREATSSGTSMAQGTGGMGGNRPTVSPVVRHFPILVAKSFCDVRVHVGRDVEPVDVRVAGGFSPSKVVRPQIPESTPPSNAVEVPLVKLAYGRSGDKGNHANVGVIARKGEYYPLIRAALTEAAVAKWFAHLFEGPGKVARFDLPGVNAVNFLLFDALGGGGIASLRNDPQGKALAQMLLDFPVPVPPAIAKDVA
ncbi:MAG: acyclic terpene utilization AtuA family protein [Alphaproteobacteria bacterium]|nr:acyclic terpene utilization AtuA family protein [Alphaproteobacteria bacterium]